jgi:hypothetical protein
MNTGFRMLGRVSALTVLAAMAGVAAGCGGGPSEDERTLACAQSDVCAARCLAETINTGKDDCAVKLDAALADAERVPASTTRIELEVAQQVAQQFGGKLDRIDCGPARRLDVGDSAECEVSAVGGQARISATVDTLGPPVEVTVDVADQGTVTGDEPQPEPTPGDHQQAIAENPDQLAAAVTEEMDATQVRVTSSRVDPTWAAVTGVKAGHQFEAWLHDGELQGMTLEGKPNPSAPCDIRLPRRAAQC